MAYSFFLLVQIWSVDLDSFSLAPCKKLKNYLFRNHHYCSCSLFIRAWWWPSSSAWSTTRWWSSWRGSAATNSTTTGTTSSRWPWPNTQYVTTTCWSLCSSNNNNNISYTNTRSWSMERMKLSLLNEGKYMFHRPL